MSDTTNEGFATRRGIRRGEYTVNRLRRTTGRFHKAGETYDKEYDIAEIRHVTRGRVWCGALSPSTTLCLPDRHVSADEADDDEIILAIVGDEHVYGEA